MKKLWFRRKSYGWGWYPASKEGWLVTIVYTISIILLSLTLDDKSSLDEIKFTYLMPFFILTVLFLLIALKKGEKPRWQWGKKK